MTTNENTDTITPKSWGLSVHTVEGPDGGVDETPETAWPHIAYTVEIRRNDQPIWRGPYKLGVGHVDPARGGVHLARQDSLASMLHSWKANPHAQFKDKHLWAAAAATLARQQRVFPKLADVLSSLILNGSTFFDAETFEEWAANFGYDVDSRGAEAIWRECDKTGRALSRHFTPEEISALREWAANQ